MKARAWLAWALVWILIAIISDRSHYNIRDVHSINWDIAVMLSPFGFLRSFVFQTDFYLRPYYWVAAKRGELFSDPVLAAAIVATLFISIAGLIIIRKERAK